MDWKRARQLKKSVDGIQFEAQQQSSRQVEWTDQMQPVGKGSLLASEANDS